MNSNKIAFTDPEIDLIDFAKKLMHSKNLILITTLIFFILSVVYNTLSNPSYKTSAVFGIGSYTLPDGSEEIIEPSEDLIDNLNINFVFGDVLIKNEVKVQFLNLNEKAIKVEILSKSLEANNNKLQDIIRYTKDRHSRISNQKLTHQKNNIQTKIEFFEKLVDTDFDSLSNGNSENQLFYQMENMKSLSELKNTLSDIYDIKIAKSQLIGETKTETLALSQYLILLIGIVSGFLMGILLALLNDFRKKYKSKISNLN